MSRIPLAVSKSTLAAAQREIAKGNAISMPMPMPMPMPMHFSLNNQ
jgi:hypothetical protein